MNPRWRPSWFVTRSLGSQTARYESVGTAPNIPPGPPNPPRPRSPKSPGSPPSDSSRGGFGGGGSGHGGSGSPVGGGGAGSTAGGGSAGGCAAANPPTTRETARARTRCRSMGEPCPGLESGTPRRGDSPAAAGTQGQPAGRRRGAARNPFRGGRLGRL